MKFKYLTIFLVLSLGTLVIMNSFDKKEKVFIFLSNHPDVVISSLDQDPETSLPEQPVAIEEPILESLPKYTQNQSQTSESNTTYEGCNGIDWVVPVHIVWRESRCNFYAVNQTGCGGWTCVGAYQFDLRHWIAKEDGGWGGCAWLGDWRDPQNQIECARQMSRNGTYLVPWNF